MADGDRIAVKVKHLHNLQNQIITEKHTIITDEPKGSGGDCLAINPVELAMGAEGSCTISVIMMFAKRMKYDLRNVEIDVIHERVRVEELKNAGTNIDAERGYAHKITKKIKFMGNLDEDQIDELKRVSKRCPVHTMIENRSYYDTSFEYEETK
jgi:uncharacterized OsmC-like protein